MRQDLRGWINRNGVVNLCPEGHYCNRGELFECPSSEGEFCGVGRGFYKSKENQYLSICNSNRSDIMKPEPHVQVIPSRNKCMKLCYKEGIMPVEANDQHHTLCTCKKGLLMFLFG